MEALIDGGSPRRGSLGSLSRHPSGSFFNVNPKSASPNNTLSTNNQHNYKDLDRFTRYFVLKTVQVIVQSRIAVDKKVKTDCRPNGNDWFNININDVAEVSDKTKSALEPDGLSVRSNWQVCCEISLKTKDGGRVMLEHWIISNKTNASSSQNSLQSKLNFSQQNQPKANNPVDRTSPVNLTSNINNGSTSAINSPGSTRIRTATFSNTLKTRLNSVDDCTGGINGVGGSCSGAGGDLCLNANNKSIAGSDTFDIKSSTSCYTLSAINHPVLPNTVGDTQLLASPSACSLVPNSSSSAHHQISAAGNNVNSQTNCTRSYGSSSIYTIYNRMSLLLKTIMTTTHIVPAYSLAARTSLSDSCVICYRVYCNSGSSQRFRTNQGVTRGSLEDINDNISGSPGKRCSSSSSSLGSLNIRQFVGPDELEHFCPIFRLGYIKTEVNELEVSLCYRTDVRNTVNWAKNTQINGLFGKAADEDCITAAKQLLAGREHMQHEAIVNSLDGLDSNKNEFCSQDKHAAQSDRSDEPLRPAFADIEQQRTELDCQDDELAPILPIFEKLLDISQSNTDFNERNQAQDYASVKLSETGLKGQGKRSDTKTEPIQVPSGRTPRFKQPDMQQNLSCGSTPKSLTDSFVFVDLNPPFASEEHNDINSFFHGPAPSFTNGSDSLKDVEELTSQLAKIEANASQIDDFVNNICVSEDEENE